MTAEGLLIDFGGVLTTPLRDAFERWCEAEGVSYDRLRDLLKASYPAKEADSIVIQVETGRMPIEEFELRLADVFSEGLQAPIAAEGLMDRMGDSIELEPRMIDAVRSVHRHGVKTALLSNSWGLHYYPHDLLGELFDEIFISGQVGMRKPDADIYRHAAAGLGLEPPACVFVDDFAVNVEAAEAVGMRGLVHERPARTIAELERLFGLPL